MSSGRKSMAAILCDGNPQNNPEVREFLLREPFAPRRRRPRVVMILPCAVASSWLSAAELAAALRCAARRSARAARTLILVTEDQPALLLIVGRHLDRHPIACQRLDAVLLHLAGRVGDNFMSGVELHAVARVGKDFGHQSFELDQLFFSHGSLQVDRRLSAVVSGCGWVWYSGGFRDAKRQPLASRQPCRLATDAPTRGGSLAARHDYHHHGGVGEALLRLPERRRWAVRHARAAPAGPRDAGERLVPRPGCRACGGLPGAAPRGSASRCRADIPCPQRPRSARWRRPRRRRARCGRSDGRRFRGCSGYRN